MKYCEYCGNRLYDEAVMCPNCKRSTIPEYIVTINRSKQFFIIGNSSTIQLDIDSKESYAIGNGQAVQIRLPRGKHKFYFHYSFRSKTVNIDLNNDTEFILEWDRITGGISVFQKD
ncbi:MAG: zinc ribbon domain-containing protein [Eubacterium sp.]|nr:zinc ribbon domain-containing protein [Eubacterium sp.]MBQ8980880.1 zinc ribbon domain-containing protein [Eubacterium sp.]MBR1531856.1 zinc ribbon domain-containing protein [Eubacterium sp.]